MNSDALKPWMGTIGAVVAVLAVGGMIVKGNMSGRPKVDLETPRAQLQQLRIDLAEMEQRKRLPSLIREASYVTAALERCGVKFGTRLQAPTSVDGVLLGPEERLGGARWHFDVSGDPRLVLSCTRMLSESHEVGLISGVLKKDEFAVVLTVFGATEDAL